MAIVTVMAIETDMAIMTVLAIKTNIHGFCDHLGHQNQYDYYDRTGPKIDIAIVKLLSLL